MIDHPDLDLGDGHTLMWLSWGPDRRLNEKYSGIPDIPRWGAIVSHPGRDGNVCVSAIHFASPERDRVLAISEESPHPQWTVESWEPLTLSPSLGCRACGDHGFIRSGRWVRARCSGSRSRRRTVMQCFQSCVKTVGDGSCSVSRSALEEMRSGSTDTRRETLSLFPAEV